MSLSLCIRIFLIKKIWQPILTTTGLGKIGWKYLLVYSCWIVVEAGLIYWLWPETSGRTLEDLAFLFEDEQAAEQLRKQELEQKQLASGGAPLEYSTAPDEKNPATVEHRV